MTVFYVTGNVKGSGKTSLVSALAQISLGTGVSTAIGKPISVGGAPEEGNKKEKDFEFYSQLDQSISRSNDAPLTVSTNELEGNAQLVERTVGDVNQLSTQSDNVIVDGLDWFLPDGSVNSTAVKICENLHPKIILVLRFSNPCELGALVNSVQEIGGDLLGVIINGVTRHRWHYVIKSLAPLFLSAGVNVLGVIPEDRRMLAPCVNDIAEHLNAEILSYPENCDELVEHFMVGGWFLDQGAYVFDRREQKAVVVRADRPDLHMAALQSSAVCLILTGGQNPIQYITYHADQLGVPLLSVREETVEIMEKLETLQDKNATYNFRKTNRFQELIVEFVPQGSFEAVLSSK